MAKKHEDINKLLDRLAPVVRKAFLASVDDITSEAQIALIVGHLRDGNIDMAWQALRLDPAFFAPLDDALRAAYLEGGRNALAGFPVIPDPFPGGAWLRGSMRGTRAPNSGSGRSRPTSSRGSRTAPAKPRDP